MEKVKKQKCFYALANAVKNNISFDMTMGEQYRDYIYVEDLVEAIIILLSKKKI